MRDDPGRPRAPLVAWTRAGLVVGIGLRAAATPAEVLALVDSCLKAIEAERTDILALATRDTRANHPALASVASLLSVPLATVPVEGLAQSVPNPSRRVRGLSGVPSVAEAAAMAFGPLALTKHKSANVTCSIARYAPAGFSGRSNAASAASTLATSSAGP